MTNDPEDPDHIINNKLCVIKTALGVIDHSVDEIIRIRDEEKKKKEEAK